MNNHPIVLPSATLEEAAGGSITVEEGGIETVAESTEGDQGTSTAGDSLSATLGEDSSELCEDLSHCEMFLLRVSGVDEENEEMEDEGDCCVPQVE